MDSLSVSSAPAAEPITTAEAKAHLGIGSGETDDDTLIGLQITAARRALERFCGMAFVTQTYTWNLDAFPSVLWVPRPPLQSVTSITYVDGSGDSTVLSASLYQVDTGGQEPIRKGRILPAYEQQWPVTRQVLNAVTVVFVAGYGAAAAVPEDIKAALKLTVGDLYLHRESAITGTIVAEIPMAAKLLMEPYRLPGF